MATDSTEGPGSGTARLLTVVVVGLLAAALGVVVFVIVPGGNLARLLGVLLVVGTAVLGARVAGGIADSLFPDYNVAEVAVEGPIVRDTGTSSFAAGSVGADADAIVDQIERADADDNAEALLVKLNTPGGEVLPSDDIRNAAADFDGPTVAYATDTCASGGYWIASGCDELWARDASVVGSIGVIGSSVNAADAADRLGLSYERFAAGKYKDAGSTLKEMTEDDRAYLQGLIDDIYDDFVDRVAEGRDMDPETIRETEARVFLGDEAHERGLVDSLGTAEDVEDRVGDLLGEGVGVREFRPARSLMSRVRGGASTVAYAFGAGVASVVGGDADGDVDLRL